jgi:SAM-dependent methyltransferase
LTGRRGQDGSLTLRRTSESRRGRVSPLTCPGALSGAREEGGRKWDLPKIRYHGLIGTNWEQIGSDLKRYPARSVWRTYCDGLNRDWLERHLPAHRFQSALKTDAFDEAVGDGVYPSLQKAAERVCAIDISSFTCRLAVHRWSHLAAAVSDVRDLSFRDDSFDLIASMSTLDHFGSVSEIELALRSLCRVLRPGGCLLLTLDNLSNPFVRFRNSLQWRFLERSGLVPYPVGITLRPDQLRELLERTGFEIRDLRALMHVPRAPAVALARLLDRAVGPRAGGIFCRVHRWFELLAKLPTWRWTGCYIAVSCRKGNPPSRYHEI